MLYMFVCTHTLTHTLTHTHSLTHTHTHTQVEQQEMVIQDLKHHIGIYADPGNPTDSYLAMASRRQKFSNRLLFVP